MILRLITTGAGPIKTRMGSFFFYFDCNPYLMTSILVVNTLVSPGISADEVLAQVCRQNCCSYFTILIDIMQV